MSMDVIRAIAESQAESVLVTVVATQGSAPRHAGARMALGPKGRVVGTIGGGRAETEAFHAATVALPTSAHGSLRSRCGAPRPPDPR